MAQEYRLKNDSPQGGVRGRPRRNQFVQGLITGVLVYLVLFSFAMAAGVMSYAAIAADLPAPNELASSASSFQTTRIYDRDGNLLNETFAPDAGRRTFVPIANISTDLINATVATEDKNFYQHPGIDFVALVRALYYAIQERSIVSGASTISQQLVKMVFLSPEQTITRKINEAVLSAEISRTYTKNQILELYLNELYYGNFAYGAAAAARTYFDKDVADLTLGEAALLAGLPQLPAVYDPYTQPERAKNRQRVVLALMVEENMITKEQADAAWGEQLVYKPLEFNLNAPHFTLLVRQQLEQTRGAEGLYQQGLQVFTTLDPDLQAEAQKIVKEHVESLAAHNASNGSLVAMDPKTGEIRALVGSADFDNVEIDGQVNMALAPRQPGSSIKPFVYLAAFEHSEKPIEERWTPGTLIADIEQEFPDGVNPPYVPTNYDEKEHGMLTVRSSLASSFNIPAVRALEFIGLDYFLGLVERVGMPYLVREDRPSYGLSLSLGSGEVPLVELTNAYAVLANGGVLVPAVTISYITDSTGNIICERGTNRPCQENEQSVGEQVISPVDAFLVTDMLSDNDARTPIFGPNSALRLDRPAAAKTGTTNDIRDVLTVGYTPDLVTGVWVGNTNNSEMRDIGGLTGAGPIWNRFMRFALADQPPLEFEPPAGVQAIEVCNDSGTFPSRACPPQNLKVQWFAADRQPLPAENDLHQFVRLDITTGKLATEFTPENAIEERYFKIYPEEYREWAEEHGIPQPPAGASDVFTIGPRVHIRQPTEREEITGQVTIIGTADAPAMQYYELQYGNNYNANTFTPLLRGPVNAGGVVDAVLGTWDTEPFPAGPYTLRLVVRDQLNNEYANQINLIIIKPTPTAPPTETPTQEPPTPTWTPEPPTPEQPTPEPPTETPTAIPVEVPTDTPTPIPAEPTATPVPVVPTDTPVPVVPTDTPVPVVPTDTPVPVEPPTEVPTETPTPLAEEPTPEPPTEVPTETPTTPVEEPTPGPTLEPTATAIELIATATPIVDVPTNTPEPDTDTPQKPGPTPTWTPDVASRNAGNTDADETPIE
ncbi:MAG: PBP1A family penicillin-binding protein [Chloroflexota bacterium]